MSNVTVLPDDSAFFTTKTDLPKDHWLHQPYPTPPMKMRIGTSAPQRKEFETALREAVKYAMVTNTAQGTDMDVDPDSVVNDTIIGLMGYFTPDGTLNTSDCTPIP